MIFNNLISLNNFQSQGLLKQIIQVLNKLLELDIVKNKIKFISKMMKMQKILR